MDVLQEFRLMNNIWWNLGPKEHSWVLGRDLAAYVGRKNLPTGSLGAPDRETS